MIKVAFIHKKNHIYLTGNYFSPQYYHFYIKGILKSRRIKVSRLTEDDDLSKENLSKFDVILLMGLKRDRDIFPELEVLSNVNIPKISCCHDCHSIDHDFIVRAMNWDINYFFYHHHIEYFYRYAPKQFNYKRVFMCLDGELYKKVLDWKYRQRDKILLTGVLNNDRLYTLRNKCKKLPYVKHIDLRQQFDGDKYQFLLQGFRANIVTCKLYTVNKYLEAMAAASLCFAETNDINKWQELGLIDKKNCVFINERDYREKMEEYLVDMNNPKWKRIAYEGRKHIMSNFTVKHEVNKFIKWMEEIV